MTIKFQNGRMLEGILLTQTDEAMRVAVQGWDDALELNLRNGVWVSDDCEPVQVEFAWSKKAPAPEITLEDCLCDPALAAKLIQLLHSGDDDPEQQQTSTQNLTMSAGSSYLVV